MERNPIPEFDPTEEFTPPPPPRNDFWIPERNLPEFHEKLDKLIRRAAKIGAPSILVQKIGEEMREFSRFEGGKKIPFFIRFEHWKVEGPSPKIGDWSFVATLQHTPAGNILRTLPALEESLPLRFRTLAPLCDHCGFNRNRKDTYILQHDLSREWKQVGRQCLKDFTGHSNPQVIAGWLETILNLASYFGGCEDFDETSGGGSSRMDQYFPISRGAAWVRATISKHGWVSAKRAREENEILADDDPKRVESTRSRFQDLHYPAIGRGREYWEKRAFPILDAAKEEGIQKEAEAALDWARNLEGSSDFEWNIKVVASQEFYSHREMGLLAAIVGCYLMNQERTRREEMDRQSAAVSSWVGTPKKRQIFGPVTLLSMKEIPSDFGVTTLISFQDADGNQMKWFASSLASTTLWLPSQGHTYISDWEIGGVYMIKATTKAHNEWKGRKETLLSRVVRESVISYPADSTTPALLAEHSAYLKTKAEKEGLPSSSPSIQESLF